MIDNETKRKLSKKLFDRTAIGGGAPSWSIWKRAFDLGFFHGSEETFNHFLVSSLQMLSQNKIEEFIIGLAQQKLFEDINFDKFTTDTKELEKLIEKSGTIGVNS